MEPIINPLWIYFINVLENVKPLLITLLVLTGGVLAVFMMWYLMTSGGRYSDEEQMIRPFKKTAKICLIVSIVSMIIIIFIPAKETMYTMMALEQMTPDNISTIGKTGENIVDYITDKIDQVVNGDKKEKE